MTTRQQRLQRLRRQRWTRERSARQWECRKAQARGLTLAQYRTQPRVQLACCGAWQPVTTLPHVCAACGRRYLEDTR